VVSKPQVRLKSKAQADEKAYGKCQNELKFEVSKARPGAIVSTYLNWQFTAWW
jgi:hypothetical protein